MASDVTWFLVGAACAALGFAAGIAIQSPAMIVVLAFVAGVSGASVLCTVALVTWDPERRGRCRASARYWRRRYEGERADHSTTRRRLAVLRERCGYRGGQ